MIKMLQKMKDRKGFTLIELIVVIAILAILAAVLIPQFTGFTDKAHTAQSLTDAKQVATAIDAYHAEHNAWPGSGNESEIRTLSGVASSTSISIGASGGFSVTADGHTAGRSGTGAVGLIS